MTKPTAVILAGGKSSRMQFDKQQIKVGDEYLIFKTIKKLKEIFSEVLVVTKTPEFYKDLEVRSIKDIYPGHGPISGIHSALIESKSDLVYVLAVDMPYLSRAYIDYIYSLYDEGLDGIVFKTSSHIEPMQALYKKTLIPLLEEAISKGDYRLRPLIKGANFRILSPEDFPEEIDLENLFTNLNTQTDLREYLKTINQN